MNKNTSITIRVDEKTKDKLQKLADDKRRTLSDFLRLVLVDIADKKIKITYEL